MALSIFAGYIATNIIEFSADSGNKMAVWRLIQNLSTKTGLQDVRKPITAAVQEHILRPVKLRDKC